MAKQTFDQEFYEVTKRLSEFVPAYLFAAIPPQAVEHVRHVVLDTLAVMAAGARTPLGAKLLAQADAEGGAPEAGVVAGNGRVSAPQAAYANAALGTCVDYAAASRPFMGSPAPVLTAAVLAAADREKAGGRDAVAAWVVGYEVAVRLSRGMNPMLFLRGWNHVAVIGAPAAAAAAAKLLKLDDRGCAAALGLAASLAGAMEDPYARPLQAGAAARIGVEAAYLAARKVDAPKDAFDRDPRNYLLQFLGAEDLDRQYVAPRIYEQLGRPFEIQKARLYIRRNAGAFAAAPYVEAVVHACRKDGIAPADVQRVEAAVEPICGLMLPRDDFATAQEASDCLPFLLAAAVLDKHVGLEHFEDQALLSNRVADMMKKVDLVRRPLTDYTHPTADIPTDGRVLIRTRGGGIAEHHVSDVAGGPDQPIPQDARYMKVAACTKGSVSDVGVGRMVALCDQLDSVADIRELTEHFRRG